MPGQNYDWIDVALMTWPRAGQVHLEVHVVAEAVARAPDEADPLPAPHELVQPHERPRLMHVARSQRYGVPQTGELPAIAEPLPSPRIGSLPVALRPGIHSVGPDTASLTVRTYREGVAAKVGHDLVLEVTRWEATVDVGEDREVTAVSLDADPRSLEVREGVRGVKPLTQKDRAEICRNIDEKVLHGEPIAFRSRVVRPDDGGSRLVVEGDLTMAGATHPVAAELLVGADGTVSGSISLTQSDWGIRPYRGLMGALKVRDAVEIVVAAEQLA